MKRMISLVSAVLLAVTVSIAGLVRAQTAGDGEKVVYHVNLGNEQASDALRNIRNHLSVDPGVKIAVVTHAKGVDFLMEGAEDKNGNPYAIPVEELAGKGVEFKVCEITLTSRNLDRNQFISQVQFVPSGVGEVTRLQQKEGYAYLKP